MVSRAWKVEPAVLQVLATVASTCDVICLEAWPFTAVAELVSRILYGAAVTQHDRLGKMGKILKPADGGVLFVATLMLTHWGAFTSPAGRYKGRRFG